MLYYLMSILYKTSFFYSKFSRNVHFCQENSISCKKVNADFKYYYRVHAIITFSDCLVAQVVKSVL